MVKLLKELVRTSYALSKTDLDNRDSKMLYNNRNGLRRVSISINAFTSVPHAFRKLSSYM